MVWTKPKKTKKLDVDHVGTTRKVRLDVIQFDPSYQRELKSNAKKIAAEFDRAAVGTIHVGNRGEGGMWCIDGQQRIYALKENGYTEWDCYVVPSSGSEYEAAVYKMINGKNRRQLSQQELFKAALTAKDPVALAVVRACDLVGWRVKLSHGGSRGWPEVSCVGTLYKNCQLAGGEAVLTRALRLIELCWPQQSECMLDVVSGGFCTFLRQYGDLIDEKRLSEALSKVPPRTVILRSQPQIGNRMGLFARELALTYNKKVRGKAKLKVHIPGENDRRLIQNRNKNDKEGDSAKAV